MLYSENFLNELRNTVKGMLLKGDISDICRVKELLEYSNIEFSDFIAPMLKDDCSISEYPKEGISNESDPQDGLVGVDTETFQNSVYFSGRGGSGIVQFPKVQVPKTQSHIVQASSVHGHYDEQGNLIVTPLEVRPQEGYNPKELGLLEDDKPKKVKPKYMPYFHDTTSPGQKEGVVIYKLKAFIVEDLVTGELLYKHTHYIAKLLNLEHGDVISFNIGDDNKLIDITREASYDFNDGINIVTNCPVLKDDDGFYVPTDMNGRSLTEHGSPVSPYNIPYNVVEAYNIKEDDSVDLYIQPNSIPYVLYVNRGF